MRYWSVAAGSVVVLLALRELFRDLSHPAQSGVLSDYIGRTFFNVLRRRRNLLSLAGPLSFVVVIRCWVSLLALGFALIYWIAFPAEFKYSSLDNPNFGRGFWTMLFFSWRR